MQLVGCELSLNLKEEEEEDAEEGEEEDGPIRRESWLSWAGSRKSLSSSRSQAGDRNGGASREDGGKVLYVGNTSKSSHLFS